MKRGSIPILLIGIFLISLLASCGGGGDQQASYEVPDKTHFRNTCWDMTRDHVIAVEQAEKVPGDDAILRYRCKIQDKFDCELFYLFDDENRLVAAGYEMNAEESEFGDLSEIEDELERLVANRKLAVDFFLEFKVDLTNKFGEPVSDDVNWYSEDFSDSYENDIHEGYAHNALYLTTRWNLPETIISEELTQGKFKVAYMKRQ